MGGADEQWAVDAVGHDVLGQQGVLFVGVVARFNGNLLEPGAASYRAQREDDRDAKTNTDRGDEVEDDRDREGQGKDGRVSAGKEPVRARS